jgi:ubiquinone/menaquinone biosynthesis C-methylase UbiE
MNSEERKKHWEKIYTTKELKGLSWYESKPSTSLEFIKEFEVPLTASIIDVGGGDSLLVDHLLEMGYIDLTVLDISESSLIRAQERLGDKASKVKWLVADAANFIPKQSYDFWHDRAAFHFLTKQTDIDQYIGTIQNYLKPNGALVVATFSEEGPAKCSGIEIKQYSEKTLSERLRSFFDKVRCIRVDHPTPFNTIQNFIFCSFKKRNQASVLLENHMIGFD